MAKAASILKTCKRCNKPVYKEGLCKEHYNKKQHNLMHARRLLAQGIDPDSGDFTLDPFIYRDGYELRIYKISKVAGIKIELTADNESHSIIVPPDQSRGLISYVKQVLKCEEKKK